MRNKTPWEAEFWRPEPLLQDHGTVFLLGGGPSLGDVDLSMLLGHRVIALNSSAVAAAEAGLDGEMLFFMDNGWWAKHQSICEAWKGPVFTLSRQAKREAPQLVKRLDMASPAPEFPPRGSPVVGWGRSSGHVGISLAIALGAARIVLLGYDMRLVDGRSHHHVDYDRPAHSDVYEEFLRNFEGWDAKTRRAGVEVLNATAGSALTEFPMVDLGDVLRGMDEFVGDEQEPEPEPVAEA